MLAFACGVIFWSPHARSEVPYLQGDEWLEAANIEAVSAGQWGFSEIYILEHRNAPWPIPRLTFWIWGVVGHADTLFVATDALLPPVVFLLAYSVLCPLVERRSVALFVAVLYVLHHSDLYSMLEPISRRGVLPVLDWYARPFHLDSILSTGSFTVSRFPFPLFSIILVLSFLGLLGPALRRGSRAAIVGAGLLMGAITYVRWFDWVLLYSTVAIAAALLLLRGARRPAATLAVIFGMAFVTGLPYFIPAVTQANDPALASAMEHVGLERTHRLFPLPLRATYPAGPLCLLALLAACPFVGLRSPGRLAFVATVLALIPATSYQVVTGWAVSPDHWYRDHVFPLTTAVAGLGLGRALFRWLSQRAARIAVLGLTGLAVLHAAGLFAYYRTEERIPYAEIREAMARVEPDAVVLGFAPEAIKVSNARAGSFLPNAGRSPVATDELLERYLIARKIFGATREEIARLFGSGFHADLWTYVAAEEFVQYRETKGLTQGGITGLFLPEDRRERWLAFFDSIPDDPELRIEFARRRYRLDYILYLEGERPVGREVYRGRRVVLAAVNPAGPPPDSGRSP